MEGCLIDLFELCLIRRVATLSKDVHVLKIERCIRLEIKPGDRRPVRVKQFINQKEIDITVRKEGGEVHSLMGRFGFSNTLAGLSLSRSSFRETL